MNHRMAIAVLGTALIVFLQPTFLRAAPPSADLAVIQRAAKNFSRLEHWINTHRSIQKPQADQDPGPVSGSLPVPAAVLAEADAVAASSESWECEMSIHEQPKKEVKFGEQTIEVIPFQVIYKGQACPIHMTASMDAETSPTDPEALLIKAKIGLIVLDPTKEHLFGFKSAKIDQDATLKIRVDQTGQFIEVGISTHLISEGGPDGSADLRQSVKLNFDVRFPMDIQAISEESHQFSIGGVTKSIRRKETMVGFTNGTAEYWIDNQTTDKTTFEGTLQGLAFFGVKEKASQNAGTLFCQHHLFKNLTLAAAEKENFLTSGVLPTAPFDYKWKNCGRSKAETFEDYSFDETFATNWVTFDIAKGQTAPLTIYFLFEEDSRFIRELNGDTFLLNCQTVPNCRGR